MTKAECTKLGIEHIWGYLSNTYGVGNTTNNFVNMAARIMLEGKKATFTSGEQMYDFMYITDTVKAIFAITEKGKSNTAYYLGSGKQRKLKEYIRMIRDTINPDIPLFSRQRSIIRSIDRWFLSEEVSVNCPTASPFTLENTPCR